jgi:anti-sigma factor RsiW
VSRRPCGSLAELRSAYVDNALSDGDRDRLLVHLAGCAACRSDVAELRKIRQLLTVSRTDPSAPADLSSRHPGWSQLLVGTPQIRCGAGHSGVPVAVCCQVNDARDACDSALPRSPWPPWSVWPPDWATQLHRR